MSEQDSDNIWQLTSQEDLTDFADEQSALPELTELELTSTGLDWEQERQILLSELEQLKITVQEYETLEANLLKSELQQQESLERIRQLEQALDDSVTTIESLKSQLKDQELLENELAATEEVANIQQQALAHLRQQLANQQQALETKISEWQAKEQTAQELLGTLENLVQTLQVEIEQLRSQQATNRATIRNTQAELEKQLIQRQEDLEVQQQRIFEVESQILETRSAIINLEVQVAEQQEYIESLYVRLSDRGKTLNQVETQLKQAQHTLEAQQELHNSLIQSQGLVREQSMTINSLYRKIEALETHLTRQMRIQVRLQQACQDLTYQCNDYQTRTTELETETAALQEQLLRQSHPNQHASDYEATIKYWKDKYTEANIQVQQLKEVLERLLADKPEAVAELLQSVQLVESPVPPNSVVTETIVSNSNETDIVSKFQSKTRPIDLPTFLSNYPWKNYRSK